jgi:hypothetical protein
MQIKFCYFMTFALLSLAPGTTHPVQIWCVLYAVCMSFLASTYILIRTYVIRPDTHTYVCAYVSTLVCKHHIGKTK